MKIRIGGERDQPDLMLDIEEESGHFFLVAIDKDNAKYDLIEIDPEGETFEIYPKEFESVGLDEVV